VALSLNQTDPMNGASTTYIRIDNVNLPSLGGGGVVKVGYYVDETSAATLNPVRTHEVVLTDSEAATLRAGGLILLYNILKGRPEFSGATDV
jgi:hypothetical protein